ncbi:MAG: hypothetical protein KAZ87_02360 [Spirochaetes bacterium]|nr:hypothetical protein [Spirochaetota bacterium]
MKVLFFVFLFSFVYADNLDIDFSDAVLKEKKTEFEVFVKPNGTEINKFKNYSEAVLPDKTVVKKYQEGKAEYNYPDGRKLIIDRQNSLRTYVSSDGKEQTISMKGKTPYGEEIESKSEIIQKDPRVEIRYASEKSDDILDNDEESNGKKINGIKIFFDDLCSSTRKLFVSDKYENGESFLIEVSFCRFAEYGFCYGKDKAVTVEIFKGGKRKEIYSFTWIDLKSPQKRKVHIEKIISRINELR